MQRRATRLPRRLPTHASLARFRFHPSQPRCGWGGRATGNTALFYERDNNLLNGVNGQLLEEAQIGLFGGDAHEHLVEVVAETLGAPEGRVVARNHHGEILGEKRGHRVVPQVFHQF